MKRKKCLTATTTGKVKIGYRRIKPQLSEFSKREEEAKAAFASLYPKEEIVAQ